MENLQAEEFCAKKIESRMLSEKNDSVSIVSTGNNQYAPRRTHFFEDRCGTSSSHNVINWLNDCETDTTMPGNQFPNKSSEMFA